MAMTKEALVTALASSDKTAIVYQSAQPGRIKFIDAFVAGSGVSVHEKGWELLSEGGATRLVIVLDLYDNNSNSPAPDFHPKTLRRI